MKRDCPAKWNLLCQNCPYSKEGICDYPYIFAEIIEVEEQQDEL